MPLKYGLEAHVQGIRLEPEVTGPVDPVHAGLALVLHDSLLKVLELSLEVVDLFLLRGGVGRFLSETGETAAEKKHCTQCDSLTHH